MEEINIAHLTLLMFSLGFSPLIIKELQIQYYLFFDEIFFLHFYVLKRKLNEKEVLFLEKNIRFYNKLNFNQKKYFDHRVSCFIKNTSFINRNLEISQEMKLYISSTIVTLTFGYRNYKLNVLENVIVYPEQYTSKKTRKLHKGEFNPKLKTLVFSWKDFLLGFDSLDDNVNLGFHEFSHVLHANSKLNNDINSVVFRKGFRALLSIIKNDKKLKSKLIKSGYFRPYAFENKFELLAVLIEHFIETPQDLKHHFPKIYKIIKKMLNFNFGNY